MIETLISIINDINATSSRVNYGSGARELELRFTLPKWIDKSRLLTMYDYTVNTYTEHIFSCNDVNKSKIRLRDYGISHESIVKYNILKRRDHVMDIDIVLSYEMRISGIPQYPAYKTISCTRYIKHLGAVTIDIKSVEDVVRLEIEINTDDYVDTLWNVMLRISDVLYNSDNIISPKIFRVLSDIYDGYISRCPLPEHIGAKKLGKLIGPWVVTQKLDGERRFLCITSYGIYSINRSGRIFMISGTRLDIRYQSIIDCEYYCNMYYIIDCIMVSSLIVTNISYISRIRRLGSLKGVLPSNCVTSKMCYICNYGMMADIISSTISSTIYDGIILINANSLYNDAQYKIKKISTCDMLFDGEYLLSSDNNKYHLSNTRELIVGTIYECQHDSRIDRWSVIRWRDDKISANHSKTIHSALNSVTLFDLYEHRYSVMAGYHNIVKEIILSTHNTGGVLLDIGTGRGSDVSKWKHYSKIYCIEPDEDNVKEIYRRVRKLSVMLDITILHCRLSDYSIIENAIREKVTSVTIFFSIMMMGVDDMLSLRNILDNLCSYNCSLDIITTSKDLIESAIGTECVRRHDDNTIFVTIPKTYIKDNMEHLVDISYIDDIVSDSYFDKVFNTVLTPHYMMMVPSIDVSHAYIYLGYNRGVCRNNFVMHSANEAIHRNIVLKTNGLYNLLYAKSYHNIIINGKTRYYCSDSRYSVIF